MARAGRGDRVTWVELKIRYLLVGRTGSKTTDEVTRAMEAWFKPLPPESRRSLTLDNRKEFAVYEAFSLASGMDVYFAHPHHS